MCSSKTLKSLFAFLSSFHTSIVGNLIGLSKRIGNRLIREFRLKAIPVVWDIPPWAKFTKISTLIFIIKNISAPACPDRRTFGGCMPIAPRDIDARFTWMSGVSGVLQIAITIIHEGAPNSHIICNSGVHMNCVHCINGLAGTGNLTVFGRRTPLVATLRYVNRRNEWFLYLLICRNSMGLYP